MQKSLTPTLFPRRGFTLLEMCMVLLIIALMAALSLPAIQSTFVEQAVRDDASQLSLMVKTAMLRSVEQHRVYVIELSSTSMALHPAGPDAPGADAPPASDSTEGEAQSSLSEGVNVSSETNSPTMLMAPDPHHAHAWIPMPPNAWNFQPGELCPMPRVRLARGNAWLEMSFNALTGNVEDEATYFP